MTRRRTMPLTGLLLLLHCAACKRNADGPQPYTPDSYSGFLVDTTVYAVDSIVRDTAGPGCFVRLYSHTGGGATLELRTALDRWPDADTTYFRIVSPMPVNTGTISVRFDAGPDSVTDFCLEPGPPLIAPLSIGIHNGRWHIQLGRRNSPSPPDRYFRIDYREP